MERSIPSAVHRGGPHGLGSIGGRIVTIVALGLGAIPLSAEDMHGHEPASVPREGRTFYFRHSDREHGAELWRSDGTAAGTRLVKDIWPGAIGSDPVELTMIGETLYFVATDPERAWELWRSDGTAAGTVPVAISRGSIRGRPHDLTPVGDALAFTVWDGNEGWTAWRSDGTADGTESFPSVTSWDPVAIGDALFFIGEDRRHGAEVWRADDGLSRPMLVKDIRRGRRGSGSEESAPTGLTAMGNAVYFAADDGEHGLELWRSDGTSDGTVLIKNIAEGPAGSDPQALTVVGETLYFAADDGRRGVELWRSDGTAEGTVLVRESRRGRAGLDPGYGMEAAGEAVYYIVDDRAHGPELWRSDGSAEGTGLVKDINPGPEGSHPWPLTSVGDTLYFEADDGEHGEELWRTDGTVDGTGLVYDFTPGDDGSELTILGSGREDVYIRSEGESGAELWITDGTPDGTILLHSAPAEISDSGDGSDEEAPDLTLGAVLSEVSPIVLEPVVAGATMGAWHEVARAKVVVPDGASVELGRIVSAGGRLVSVGDVCAGWDCFAVGWHSADGSRWDPARFPGQVPVVAGIARASGRLVTVGYVGRRRWEAAIWSSRDGRVWRRRPAPPVDGIDEVAGSSDVVLVVGSDGHMWRSTDLTDWRRLERPRDVSVAHGPGGFLAYRGGGQDSWSETEVWRSRDGLAWSKVRLTKAARSGNDGVSIFPLEDGWVLATHQPGPIFTSRRGTRWRPAPRPPFMIHWAWWIISDGERVHAQGEIGNFQPGLWTWTLGERADDPRLHAGLAQPVRWRGGYLSVHGKTEDGRLSASLWRLRSEPTGTSAQGRQ